MKHVDSLDEVDFRQYPVWQFSYEEEMYLFPIQNLPVHSFRNCLVGLDGVLASGVKLFAILTNVDLENVAATSQFLSAQFSLDGERIKLARYFDDDWESKGPRALAARLGLKVEDVFPISFDLSPYTEVEVRASKLSIEARPVLRLSEDERLDLLMGSL